MTGPVRFSAFLPCKEEKIYDGLIRLHIIANSDSETDQRVKLSVRDELLKISDTYFSSCASVGDTEKTAESLKETLVSAADSVIAASGLGYRAYAVIGKERYETREYDGISFPAGEYTSFRIVLGNGEGKNWWCVLFPPLCLSASSAEKGLSSAGIDTESQKTFTSVGKRYRFKFKILEWLFS